MTILGLWGYARVAQAKVMAAGLVAAGMAVAGAASAADMLPMKAPAAPYNWSGCFVGGFFGWGNANDWHTTDVNNFVPNGQSPWLYSLNSTAIGGGYVGCNWQPTPGGGFVLGIDGEGGYMSLSGPGTQPFNAGGPTVVTDNSKIGSGYGMIGGRVGWVFLEKIHVYGKVGVGFYQDSSTISIGLVPGGSATGSKSQTPLAFGGGAEFPLTDHWIGRAEYLYFEKGSSYTLTGTGVATGFSWKEDPATVQTFKLGAAYKF
jgi:outer membrane immunogenic protein